jgi:RNA polymerase-binding transcription factor DksA
VPKPASKPSKRPPRPARAAGSKPKAGDRTHAAGNGSARGGAAKTSRTSAPARAAKTPAKGTGAAASKPAAKGVTKPATSKPAGPKPTGAKPAASKSAASKPAASKSAGTNGRAAKDAHAKARPAASATKAPSSNGVKAPSAKAGGVKPAPRAPEATEPTPVATPSAAGASNDGKSGRKGITIVGPKPAGKPKARSSASESIAKFAGQLLGGDKPVRRPLIPSGPKADAVTPLGAQHVEAPTALAEPRKTPYNKKELQRFREILLQKRRELAGDIADMESQALGGSSGSLSHMPQHIAEQGSEAYDQSLALDLAAADRKLIREIDEALKRVDNGTFGVCELTGKPIKPERLEELPWTRYSIEAARELERRSMRA